MPYDIPITSSASGADFAVNSYSTVGGGTLTQKVFSQFDMYKPNEFLQVFERHGQGPSWRAQLRAMGFNRPTAAPTVGHYEAPWKKSTFQFDTIVTASTGPGTSIVVQLAAASMYVPGTTGATVNGVAAKASYPIVGDVIAFPDGKEGRISAKDTTTNPAQHRLTIQPLQTTTDLVTVVTGVEYFVPTNQHGEGSTMPTGRVPRIFTYHNTFHTVKNSAIATGSEMTNQTYFDPIPGMTGSMFMRVEEDMMYLFEDMYDGALLWGQETNNIVEFNPELGHDVDVSGTEGLIRFGTTAGFNDTYTVGAYSLTDFNVMSEYYERQRITNWNMHSLQGMAIRNEVEDVLLNMLNGDLTALLTKNYFYGGMVDDPSFREGINAKDPNDWAVSVGFTAVKKGGRTYSFCTFHQFNEAVGAGAPGYNYPNWQITMPIGYMKNKRTSTDMPTVGYEYKALNGMSREHKPVELGGSGNSDHPVTKYDIYLSGLVGEFAFHGTCANAIAIQKP